MQVCSSCHPSLSFLSRSSASNSLGVMVVKFPTIADVQHFSGPIVHCQSGDSRGRPYLSSHPPDSISLDTSYTTMSYYDTLCAFNIDRIAITISILQSNRQLIDYDGTPG